MDNVTPTLQPFKDGVLDTVQEQLWSLLLFCFHNPGRTFKSFEDMAISFRQIEANYLGDPNGLSEELADRLTEAILRIFPGKVYNVEVTHYDVFLADGLTDPNRYGLTITITDVDGQLVLDSAKAIEIPATGQITINYSVQ